jgi:integrase
VSRSRWGSARKLPSGRYQARYRIDGLWKTAPATFRTKGNADAFLAATRADLERGTWVDPAAGQVELALYCERWLSDRPNLRPRTRDLYRGLLRLHILPALGATQIGRLSPAQVRTWRAAMIKAGRPGPSTIAKCYRLLHAICATGVEDSVISRNPCVIKGASVERPGERPVATIQQVYALAEAIEPRYRAMMLLATFCGLRVGELRALRQRNLDLLHRTVNVVEQYQQLADGTLLLGPPKTDAGRRKIAIPDVIVPDLDIHLASWCTPGRDNLVFPGASGRPFRTATVHAAWQRALSAIGIEGLRFHDLRHTGNTLAAATGASTKELMARMGHASSRAALIYQHATHDRDAAIAAGLSSLVVQSLDTAAPSS